MPSKGRDNKTYRDLSNALRRKAQRDNLPCWICGHPIDWAVDWRHPMSYTYDHIEPIANGGNPRGEGRPAHRSCNSRRGNDARKTTLVTPPATTRQW